MMQRAFSFDSRGETNTAHSRAPRPAAVFPPPPQMAHDPATQRLRTLWETAQAKIARATKTKAGAEGA